MEVDEIVGYSKTGCWKDNRKFVEGRLQKLASLRNCNAAIEALTAIIIKANADLCKSKTLKSEQVNNLLEIILMCHQLILETRQKLDVQKLKNLNTRLKILSVFYHCLKYFADQGIDEYCNVIRISDQFNKESDWCLQVELSLEDNSVFANLHQNVYIVLWNTAAKISEKSNGNEYCTHLLILRKKALVHLKSASKDIVKLCKQAKIAIFTYHKSSNGNNQQSKTFYPEIFEQICEMYASNDENLETLQNLILFSQDWINFNINKTLMKQVLDIINVQQDIFKKSVKEHYELSSVAWNFYISMVTFAIRIHPFEDSNFKQQEKRIQLLLKQNSEFICQTNLKKYGDFIFRSTEIFSKFIKAICNSEVLLKKVESYFNSYFKSLSNWFITLLKMWDSTNDKSSEIVMFSNCIIDLLKLCFFYFKFRLEAGIDNETTALVDDVVELARHYSDVAFSKYPNTCCDIFVYVRSIWNLISIFHSKNNYEEVRKLMDLCSDILLKIIKSNYSKLEETNFLSYFKVYISTLIHLDRHLDALHYIAKVLASGYKEYEEAMYLWAFVKQRRSSVKKDDEILKLTTVDLISLYRKSIKKEEMISLLNMEIIVYKERSFKYQHKASIELNAALEQLQDFAEDDCDKAYALIRRARILITDFGNVSSISSELCLEAISLLTRAKKKSHGKNVFTKEDCYLAQAYFCLYLIDAETQRKLSKNVVEQANEEHKQMKSAERSQESQNVDESFLDSRFYGNPNVQSFCHISLKLDLEVAQNLDLAFQTWSSVIHFNMNIIPSIADCLDDLITIAEIYSILRLTTKEFSAWRLARKIAKASKNGMKLSYATCRIASILSHWGLTERATVYISEVKSSLQELNENSNNMKFVQFYTQLCESDLLLKQNKVLDGWKCLETVLKELDSISFSMTCCLLKAEAKLLQSKFCQLSTSVLPLSERAMHTAIDLATCSMQYVLSVISSNESIGFYNLMPRAVNCLFDCTLHLGKLYLNIGAPREALCFLKQQLNWAYKLCLANRSAEVLLQLAEIDVLSCDHNCCQTKLEAVIYILKSEGVKLTDETAEAEVADADISFEVRSNARMQEFSTSSPTRNDLQASPILVKSTDIPNHSKSCGCEKCKHLIFHQLCSKVSHLQARCFYLQEDFKLKGLLLLQTIYREIDDVYAKERSLIVKCLQSSYKNLSDKTSIHSSIQIWKLEMACTLGTMYLREYDIAKAEVVVTEAYKEAMKLTSTGFPNVHVFIAHLKYLHCLMKLSYKAKKCGLTISEYFNSTWMFTNIPISNQECDSDIDFLEAKTAQLNLKDNLVDCMKTPMQKSAVRSRKKTELCKAPKRKHPLLSLNANQYDESDNGVLDNYLDPNCSDSENNDENIINDKSVQNWTGTSRVTRNRIKSNSSNVLNSINIENKNAVRKEKISTLKNEVKTQQTESFSKIIPLLESAIDGIAHQPTYPLYSDLNVLLALCKGNRHDSYHLLESVGVTLRHQAMKISFLRLKKNHETSLESEGARNTQSFIESLRFNKSCSDSESHMKKMCSNLPNNCVVCQINIVPKAIHDFGKHQNPDLLITRLQNGCSPITVKVCVENTGTVTNIVSEFRNILQEVNASHRIFEKHEWWKRKADLNERIKVLLKSMEDVWLGYWKCLLLGNPAHKDDVEILNCVVDKLLEYFTSLGFEHINSSILECIVDAVPWLSFNQLRQALANILEISLNDDRLKNMCKYVQHKAKCLNSKTLTRQLTVLVLDKEVHGLPWESLPMLSNNIVTRMPSVHFISSYMSRHQNPKPINTSNGFYVLNPGNDLKNAQKLFQEYFDSLNWPGIIQRPPTKEEWAKALSTKSFFVYAGHGNGVQYCGEATIQNQDCHASVLLVGCSSVKLRSLSNFEPFGIVFNYLIAGSPCIFGTLWNVTDNEINSILMDMLKNFLTTSKSKKTLTEALTRARTVCRLHFVTGASTVIYGLPVIAM